MKEKFSLRRAIEANYFEQKQAEPEASVIARCAERHSQFNSSPRSLLIPVEARAALKAGGNPLIQEEKAELVLPLGEWALKKAGARFFTGLKGDFVFPEFKDIKAYWAGENGDSKDAGGSFTKARRLTPKRLTSHVMVSKQLLMQDSIEVEQLFRDMLAEAVLRKLEQTVLSTGKEVENTPDGLFATAPSLGEITWENIVAMEGTLAEADALRGSLAYIAHPTLVTTAKTTLKDLSGGGGFIANGQINEYPAIRSSEVPSDLGAAEDEYGIIFGNWSDLVIGQWGALDIITNPYTHVREGMVKIVINSYWDFKTIRNESFAKGSMK